jgi:hypothetical protein
MKLDDTKQNLQLLLYITAGYQDFQIIGWQFKWIVFYVPKLIKGVS